MSSAAGTDAGATRVDGLGSAGEAAASGVGLAPGVGVFVAEKSTTIGSKPELLVQEAVIPKAAAAERRVAMRLVIIRRFFIGPLSPSSLLKSFSRGAVPPGV